MDDRHGANNKIGGDKDRREGTGDNADNKDKEKSVMMPAPKYTAIEPRESRHTGQIDRANTLLIARLMIAFKFMLV